MFNIMKLHRILLAGMAVALLAACDQLSNPDTPHVVTLPDPAFKGVAEKYVIYGAVPFKTIELTESGDYIAVQTEKFDQPGEKLDKTHVGTYTGSDHKFFLKGLGELVVNETRAATELILTLDDGTVIRMLANVEEDSLTGSFADNLCRTWKPKETLIQVMGDEVATSLGVGRVFPGCDPSAIVAYLRENDMKIEDDLSGYKVETISLTAKGTVKIVFAGAEPFIGEWEPDLATGELSYNFGDDNTYEVISEYGTGKGSLSFNDKDELVIILDAVITATDKKYAAKVTLTLQAV